jgi:hypothetical protein
MPASAGSEQLEQHEGAAEPQTEEARWAADRVDQFVKGLGAASVYAAADVATFLVGKPHKLNDPNNPTTKHLRIALVQHPDVEIVQGRRSDGRERSIYKIYPEGRDSEDGRVLAEIEDITSRLFALVYNPQGRYSQQNLVKRFVEHCMKRAEEVDGAAALLSDPQGRRIATLLAAEFIHNNHPAPTRKRIRTPEARAARLKPNRAPTVAPTGDRTKPPKPSERRTLSGNEVLQIFLDNLTSSLAGNHHRFARLAFPGVSLTLTKIEAFDASLQAAIEAGNPRVLPLPYVSPAFLLIGKEDEGNEARIARYFKMAEHMDEVLETVYYTTDMVRLGHVLGVLQQLMRDAHGEKIPEEEWRVAKQLIYTHPWWISRQNEAGENRIILPRDKSPEGQLQVLFDAAIAEGRPVLALDEIQANIKSSSSLVSAADVSRRLQELLETHANLRSFSIADTRYFRWIGENADTEGRELTDEETAQLVQAVEATVDRLRAEEFSSAPLERFVSLVQRAMGRDLPTAGTKAMIIACLDLHPAVEPREDDRTMFDIELPEAEQHRGRPKQLDDKPAPSQRGPRVVGSDIHETHHLRGARLHNPSSGTHTDKYSHLRDGDEQ